MADVTEVANLLHGKERHVFGDAGYTGAQKRAPPAQSEVLDRRQTQRGEGHRRPDAARDHRATGARQASIRAAVEHPFRVLKRQFGYAKGRYKGLAKDGAQVTTLFALVNLWMLRKTLMQAT